VNYTQSESELYALLRTGKLFKLPKGQVIDALNESNKLNLIHSGFVQRYLVTKDGTKSIQAIYGSADIFPLTSVFNNVFDVKIYSGPAEYYYESLTDVEIFSISNQVLLTSLETKPQLYKDLFYASGLRLNSYIHRLESMSLRVSNKIVAHQLLFLASVYGDVSENGTTIIMPLTHKNIADMLNLARETVTHSLNRLEDMGMIIADKNITITNIEKLRLYCS
jgi:CRP-like cAMP-binding protein